MMYGMPFGIFSEETGALKYVFDICSVNFLS